MMLLCASAVVFAVSADNFYFGWVEDTSLTSLGEKDMRIVLGAKMSAETKARLHQKFQEVSDIRGEEYRNYLSREELVNLVPPEEEHVDAIFEWCARTGLECATMGTGDIVVARGSVALVEKAMNTSIAAFTNERTQGRLSILRSKTPVEIPTELEGHVDLVSGLDNFPTLFPTKKIVSVSASHQITPSLLKGNTLYNITDNASANSKSSMAVAEFQGQGYLPSDLATFESEEGLPSQTVRSVLGGDPNADKTAGVEASLDIQYIVATGTGIPVDFYLQSGGTFDLLEFAGFVLNETDPALVWSVSYGEGINGGIGGTIPVDTAQRLNAEFEKFGTRGLSVFVSSGDSGVYNRVPVFGRLKFHPSYPSCLPAVTSVGATELNSDGVEDSAVAFSGGGFTPTNYFARANDSSWQADAVDSYLSSGVKLPPEHLWDKNGRGLPDVSAVGVDYKVYTNGGAQGVSGTSASCPAVAGIFALVNDQLLAAGKNPLGFVNPFIYAHQDAFRDITKGFNNGGSFHILSHGFYATKGWDPLTGVGTPNYVALKKAALAL